MFMTILIADEQHQDTLEFFYSREGEDCRNLKTYLEQEKPGEAIQQQVERIIEKSQVIYLQYRRDTLLYTDSLLTVTITRPDSIRPKGNIYINFFNLGSSRKFRFGQRISMAFGKGYLRTAAQPEPENWLGMMRFPIEMNYNPTFVRIIYLPSESVLKAMFKKYKSVVSQVVDVLDSLKPQYAQLQDFNSDHYSMGEWNGAEWPHFPNIFYRDGLREIPNSKGQYEKVSNNWCEIGMWFQVITGSPYVGGPADQHAKIYPRQGICAKWRVVSANDDLNKKVLQTINDGIRILNDFEKQLESKD
jgi:hypothetical protein